MSSSIRIAVSATGGGAGQSILKSLQDTDYEVVALDGEPLGAGLYTATKSYIIPYARDPQFIDRVLEICKQENCKLYFPGMDAELPYLAKAVDRFTEAGIQVIVSSPEVIAMSDDKLLTYTTLKGHDVSVPYTIDMRSYLSKETSLPAYPFILKEREGGARSQGIHIVKTEEDFKTLGSSGLDFTPYVAQEYIEGDEYTCGTVNLDGECKGVIVMRRTLRDGDTYKCFSVKNDVIEAEVRKAVEAVKPFGPCNVQLRLKDGKPYIFEFNARCSGTTGARTLCGFNEPKMIADYLCFNKEPEYTIVEQTILRYWKELVVPNEAIDEVTRTGVFNGPAKKL